MTFKSLLCMLCVLLVLALGLSACGGDSTDPAAETTAETTTAPTEPHVSQQLYFNIDKLLNKDLVRNKDRISGLYNLRFFVNGEYITLQTDRDNVISQVDNFFASVPEYDKEGMVRKLKSVQSSLGGAFFDGLRVTAVDGAMVSVEGTVGGITLSDEAVIFDMTGLTAEIGTAGQILVGDKICAYLDAESMTQVVYIIGRSSEHDNAHECDHCNEAVTWTAWDGTQPLTSGHYRLASDVVLDSTITLTNEDVVLCLDGYSLSCADRVFVLEGSAKLSVTDHAGYTGVYKGTVIGNGIPAAGLKEKELLGGTIYVDAGAELNMYGGELRSGISADSQRKIYQGATVYALGNVNMYEGVITGGHAIHRGGGLYMAAGSVFNMEGGVIRYGSCGNSGGTACFAVDSEANISGGKLIAGIAVNLGGGIYTETSMVVSGGEFTGDLSDGTNAEYGGVFGTGKNITVEFLSGVEFYGGSAVEGGNISCRLSCHMILNEGVVIRDGYATRSGGNVVNFGNLDIKGARIINGVAATGGGNFYSYSNGDTVTNLYSGEITGGKGGTGGNVRLAGNPGLYEEGSILNVYGGRIADGEATSSNGGNIVITVHSELHIYGGEITGGKAAGKGGGIYSNYSTDYQVAPKVVLGADALVTDNADTDVYLNTETMLSFDAEKPFGSNAKVGVAVANPTAPFAVGAPEDALEVLFSNEGKTIVNNNGELSLQ